METYNLTEKLALLEQKVQSLIEIIKLEKERSAQLSDQKQELLARLEVVETKLLKGSEEYYQDKELATMAIDELIANISDACAPEDFEPTVMKLDDINLEAMNLEDCKADCEQEL